MNRSLYLLVASTINGGIRLAALFGSKRAGLWVSKRKKQWNNIEAVLSHQKSPIIWVHCASRGETEQALPIIDRIKATYPTHKILLTLFSPSGERTLDNVDYCFFLPEESPKNVLRFLTLCQPDLVIWVKYEFWFLYLEAIHKRKIPLILVSVIFRKNQLFFHPRLGGLHRRMLSFFSSLHVQNEESKSLLQHIGIDKQVFVSGDTRFDRVYDLAKRIQHTSPPTTIPPFTKKTIVCGSTLTEDHSILAEMVRRIHDDVTFVITPHHVDPTSIHKMRSLFPDAPLLSEIDPSEKFDKKTIIVDAMGLLMTLYSKAYITYVGGGFSRSAIHNTIEPASFGVPVVFGPNYQKHYEATSMVEKNACRSVSSDDELAKAFQELLQDPKEHQRLCEASRSFVENNCGATQRIIEDINRNQWLHA